MGRQARDSASLAALQPGLRHAFAGEVIARLPRLLALSAGPVADLETVRRDAHTLGSSACLIGEPDLARLAREVEEHLSEGPVAELVTALRAWTP